MSPERPAANRYEEALTILDELCQDSLEVPLNHVDGLLRDGVLEDYEISHRYWRLREIITELANA